ARRQRAPAGAPRRSVFMRDRARSAKSELTTVDATCDPPVGESTACGYSRKAVQQSTDRGWMPSAATRGPNTARCQFCCDLPQRRNAGYQIGKHRMEVLSTLDRCGGERSTWFLAQRA